MVRGVPLDDLHGLVLDNLLVHSLVIITPQLNVFSLSWRLIVVY